MAQQTVAEFGQVDNSQVLGEGDFRDVYQELITIKAKYYELGIMLGLRPGDLAAIHRGNDIDRAFTEILLTWLRHNYDVHKHGPPTWRNLVEAVDHPAGGNNHALATSIANKHSDTVIDPPLTKSKPGTRRQTGVSSELEDAPDLEPPGKGKVNQGDTSQVREANNCTSDSIAAESDKEVITFQCPCKVCSLESYVSKGCRVSQQGSYPFINLPQLKLDERRDLVQVLNRNTDEIKQEFRELLESTIISLKDNNISTERFLGCALNIVVNNSSEAPITLLKVHEEELQNAKSIDAIFNVLIPHMSFFNYGILTHVITNLGSNADKTLLDTYHSKFNNFCKLRVFEVSPLQVAMNNAEKCDRKKFVVLLTIHDKESTLMDIDRAVEKLANIFGLKRSALSIDMIDTGSVLVVISLPTFIANKIFPLVSNDIKHLKENGYIIFVSEHSIIVTPKPGPVQKQTELCREDDFDHDKSAPLQLECMQGVSAEQSRAFEIKSNLETIVPEDSDNATPKPVQKLTELQNKYHDESVSPPSEPTLKVSAERSMTSVFESDKRRPSAFPTFTLDNVMESLKGKERLWGHIGIYLYVPDDTRYHIKTQHSTASDRLREVLLYALSLHPFPGWRMMIRALHIMREYQLAAEIQDYAEPLTDERLTVANVVSVLSKMRRRWNEGGIFADNLSSHLGVPWSKQDEISRQHRTLQDQHAALAQYLLYSLPGFSWATFAGALYYLEEGAALQEARRYINREEDVDHTLTIDNFLAALQSVTYWKRLGEWLDVPLSRRDAMSGMEDVIRGWLKHHPAPSWKLVAWALYRRRGVTEHNVLKQLYKTYITGPMEILRRMDACRQAIKDKGSIDQTIMQGIFFGLPRSGKTSSKKRLVGKTPSRQQASTGVAEKVSRIEIEKTTVQSVSKYSWNEVSELNDEPALVVDDIVNNQPETTTTDVSTTLDTIEHKKLEQKPTVRNESRIHNIVKKVKSLILKKHANIPPEQVENTGSDQTMHDAPLKSHHFERLSRAVEKASLTPRQQRERRWTIYLSDVGGQPEFQESLPALVSGPSLYFLTFPLHKGLKERFKVEYQHPNGKSIVPFQMTSTMEEVLLQSLATIASTKSHTRLDGKAVNAKVLFIATHKDKIQSEQQLLDIDQQLQKTIEKTTAYTENMIVFQSQHQMVFAVDNTSSDESDIQQVRDAVERIGTSTDEYKISLPTTWMIFSITLRHFPERVLTIEKCMEIAKECGIDSREELNNALYILHHNVGVIRYFQDHPELQGFVIKEPWLQYIFDTLTEMMVCTFNFEDLGPYQHKEFVKKGIFATSLLHKLSTESDVLTGDKFATLLEHHHIIIPIEVDDNGKVVKYFAPAALPHAELPPDTQAKKIIPTLVVAFKSGFCPTGMFGSLVVQLLKDDKRSNFEWKLVQDEIYRNQISFTVGPYDSFRFSLTATCIQVDCMSSLNVAGRVPLGKVCYDIRNCIVDGVQLIIQKLNYNEKASCYLAFNCPEHEQSASCHLATINFYEGKACTLTCTDSDRVHPLHENHQLWFSEEMKLPSLTERDECNSESGDVPTMPELLLFKRSNGECVNVAEEVSVSYAEFAAQLLKDDNGARIRNIERAKLKDPKEINIEILREWLKGGERRPVTWSALARVLEDINKGELAAQIKQVKSLN